MTREEAIDIIKCLAWHTRPNEEEIIEQIIKTLEQEHCDDYISRQAVLNILMPYCADDDGSVETTEDLRNALDDIESLPPVHIRPKGEWIRYPKGSGIVVCNQCKGIQRDCRVGYTNFCNKCGADMRGEENGKK